LCADKGELKTLELLKIKGVAVVTIFAIMIVSASVYTMHKSAIAESHEAVEEPHCTVYFEPDMVNVAVGETFKVAVFVDDVSNLYGFEIGLMFDSNVIKYVGSKNPQWKFIAGVHPRLEYLFWVAGITPQNGGVELMEFTFKAVGKGNTGLSLYVHKLATSKYWEVPHDYVGWPIPHLVSEAMVTVS
jgi:hypothetical protein